MTDIKPTQKIENIKCAFCGEPFKGLGASKWCKKREDKFHFWVERE